MSAITWPEAFMITGVAFAVAWLGRSFFRAVTGEKP